MRLATMTRDLFSNNAVSRIARLRPGRGPTALGILIVLATTRGFAEESFPFTAFVAHDRTQARSGPGDDHYATDELSRGQKVEVYQRVEGGWLAIRPPATSFSWVSLRDLQIAEPAELAEVVGSTVVSWIGSNIADVADHRWLVKLDRDETVTVLGKERRRLVSAGKSDVFCKIAPPSGEFRWLHEDELVQEQRELAATKDPNVQLADFRVALQGTPRPEPKGDLSPKVIKGDVRKDSFVARGKSPETESASGRSLEPFRKLALIPKSSSTPAETKTDLQPKINLSGDLESQLRDLDVQLSLIVAQPAANWNFTALRSAADQLATRGSSTLERARVQIFLDKLSEFEGLKSRYALMAPKPPPVSRLPKLFPTSTKATPEPAIDPRFDGTGWLFPVHSSKKTSPPYALLDQAGNILQFVSPSPGLNLNRYLRKEIGIIGQKDQPPTLEKPHLTAHRIIELDRHRPRGSSSQQ